MTDSSSKDPPILQYILTVSPLGMLYGSAGPFLSPENLVGRSGDRFPPNATTVAGLYGATQWKEKDDLNDLYIVGPFWAKQNDVENFYVPMPLNFRTTYDAEAEHYQAVERWQWNEQQHEWQLGSGTKEKKAVSNAWIAINNWPQLQHWPENGCAPFVPIETTQKIWRYHPHLHPRLEDDQRRVVPIDSDQGSLFLENGVQLDPDYCLVYLTSRKLDSGWYRFGGEGHLADIECHDIPKDSTLQNLLSEPVGECFSLVTPAVWGTQRFSYRFPVPNRGSDEAESRIYKIPTHIQSPQETTVSSFWELAALMTDRPIPFRFRLGGTGKTKRLSRGRYSVPAGTVYQLAQSLDSPWQQWQKEWFPLEGYSYQHWGCGFALPLQGSKK
jgi:CRISPR-associated protein Cmr3